jgi:hypothetical protein
MQYKQSISSYANWCIYQTKAIHQFNISRHRQGQEIFLPFFISFQHFYFRYFNELFCTCVFLHFVLIHPLLPYVISHVLL